MLIIKKYKRIKVNLLEGKMFKKIISGEMNKNKKRRKNIMRKPILVTFFATFLLLVSGFNAFAVKDEESSSAMSAFLKTIDLGIYVDTSYQYVFDALDDEDVRLRSLYPDNNDFTLNAFTLSLAKEPEIRDGIWDLLGFRADILFGDQADILASDGLESDNVDPYQAYIHVLAPIGSGLNIYAGKYVTLMGYEVIEAKSNPNITKSILFGSLIAFTHTGIRLGYSVGSVDLTLGLVNGWDNVDDNNSSKTIESQIAYSYSGGSISDLWLGLTGYFGEEADEGGGWREVITAVGSITLMDKLSFIVDSAFGWEQDVVDMDLGLDSENVSWWGIAGYVVYEVHPAVVLSLRAEYADDPDGVRTGTAGGVNFWEITPTAIFKPFKGFIYDNEYLDNFEFRVEYRYDSASEPFFPDADGNLKDSQDAIIFQALYWIDL